MNIMKRFYSHSVHDVHLVEIQKSCGGLGVKRLGKKSHRENLSFPDKNLGPVQAHQKDQVNSVNSALTRLSAKHLERKTQH